MFNEIKYFNMAINCKEYGDECAEGNQWDWQDIAADCIGALCGGGFAAIIGVIC